MSSFLKKIFAYFLLPIAIGILLLIFWDPFKVFFKYSDYYTGNNVCENRENVCFKLFNSIENRKNISNVIIGSSRSQAFKTNAWSRYKKGEYNANYFHWDGNGLGLYRATNIVNFLSKSTHKINQILLIIDTDFLREISNSNTYLLIQPPNLSHQSAIKYYSKFLVASANLKFLLSNFIYNSTDGHFYGFMENYLKKSSDDFICNKNTADIWYPNDILIKKDSAAYYSELLKKGTFYSRPQVEKISEELIKEEQLKLLEEIKAIVLKNDINIKIIISPLYNQIKFNPKDLEILGSMFGKNNIYDFSGKNILTEDYRNYYEESHYKPYIANIILDSVYNKTTIKGHCY